MEVQPVVKIRVHGPVEDVAAAVEALQLALDVRDTSVPYRDRAPSSFVRVYLDVRGVRCRDCGGRKDTAAPDDDKCIAILRDALAGAHGDGAGTTVTDAKTNGRGE